jgi:uncharacterized membrane protein
MRLRVTVPASAQNRESDAPHATSRREWSEERDQSRPNEKNWPHRVATLSLTSAARGNQDMERVLQTAVVVFAALATGGLMVNWIGLGRAMSRLSASSYVEFHQATNQTFDPYMPIVVVGALLGGIVLAILSPGIHSLSGELAIAGSLCYVAVLAIAFTRNVRINKQIASWSVESPPADWAPIRANWIRFHIVRTLFSLPGLACYVLACLVSR